MNPFIRKKNRVPATLNLVPVMDMLTAIIFFLLVSTTFIEFAKLPVPPSGVKTITDPVVPPPLAPKLYVDYISPKNIGLLLVWSGVSPGEFYKKAVVEEYSEEAPYPEKLKSDIDDLLSKFIKNHPLEKTLQLGFGENIPYRSMIAVMDGVLPLLPDIVLLSYKNTGLMVQAVENGIE